MINVTFIQTTTAVKHCLYGGNKVRIFDTVESHSTHVNFKTVPAQPRSDSVRRILQNSLESDTAGKTFDILSGLSITECDGVPQSCLLSGPVDTTASIVNPTSFDCCVWKSRETIQSSSSTGAYSKSRVYVDASVTEMSR